MGRIASTRVRTPFRGVPDTVAPEPSATTSGNLQGRHHRRQRRARHQLVVPDRRPDRVGRRAARRPGRARPRQPEVRRRVRVRGDPLPLGAAPRGLPRLHGPPLRLPGQLDHPPLPRRGHRDRRRGAHSAPGADDRDRGAAHLDRRRAGRAGAVVRDPRRAAADGRRGSGRRQPDRGRAQPGPGTPARRRAGAQVDRLGCHRRHAQGHRRRRLDRSHDRRRRARLATAAGAAPRHCPRCLRRAARRHGGAVPLDRRLVGPPVRPGPQLAACPGRAPAGPPRAGGARRPAPGRGGPPRDGRPRPAA